MSTSNPQAPLTNKRANTENPVRPYTYSDFLNMKPGSLIDGVGIYRYQNLLAPSWYISKPETNLVLREKGYVYLTEWHVNECLNISTCKHYKDIQIFELIEPMNRFMYSSIEKYKIDFPIGMFMGKILRNVVSRKGFFVQIWNFEKIVWI